MLRIPAVCALTAFTALAVAAMLPVSAVGQDAQTILATAAQKQAERWAGVQNYSVEKRLQGAPMGAPVYYEKVTEGGFVTFRQVPFNEWMKPESGETMSAEGYETMAMGYEMLGDAYVSEGDPMAPLVKPMMDDAATMMRFTAEAERSGKAYADEIQDAPNVGGLAAVARHARVVGRETVNGREAFHLRADDLSDMELPEAPTEGELGLRSADLWIDAAEYVPLRYVLEGEYAADGQSVPVTFSVSFEDYVHSGPLYEPRRQVGRVSGLLEAMATDPERREELEEMRRELAKAREQMEQMQEQLDQLPASARGMVEGQVEKARRQMEMMAGEGVLESVTEMRVIGVNEGPPKDWRPSPGS